MKIKLFIIVAFCSLLFSASSKAFNIQIIHWEITSSLVNGKLYIPTGGSASINFTVYFNRSTDINGNPYGDPIHFVLGSVNHNNNLYSAATAIFLLTNSDFSDASQTFGHKTYTVTVKQTDLPDNDIVLLYDNQQGVIDQGNQAPLLYAITNNANQGSNYVSNFSR